MTAALKRSGSFQILSLDGGGFKGLYSAAVLAAFEEDLGHNVTDHFDLIVGTSTGGIIALALGIGIRPRQIVEMYQKHGRHIFPHPVFRGIRHVIRSKYRSGPLRAAINEVLDDHILGESGVRLVIPAYNITTDTPYLFKTPHHERLRTDWKVPLVDVAMATAAAPTYFPASLFNGTRFVDGGVWANNPAVIGIAEAVSMCGASLSKIRLFSLGTTNEVKKRHRRLNKGGWLPWALDATDVILLGQSKSAQNLAVHLLSVDRALRIDPVVPAKLLGIDRVNPEALIGYARNSSRDACPHFVEGFCDHQASPYIPYYGPRKD